MKINNLSQLKKELQKGRKFIVINHQKPELVGHIREVNKVQTNVIYTVIPDNPDHEYSKCNGGKGSRMDYNKASHYEFGDTVKWYNKPVNSQDNTLIMEFKLI